jgi:hypothetical protein
VGLQIVSEHIFRLPLELLKSNARHRPPSPRAKGGRPAGAARNTRRIEHAQRSAPTTRSHRTLAYTRTGTWAGARERGAAIARALPID